MQHVYGPVPSRRLGQSLGIDTIPLKTCNWNCVYCQLGRSKPLVNERKDYIPLSEIISEVKRAVSFHYSEDIDWITFVGSGEPTLHAGIGWLIKEVKKMTDTPVAVITNGSLLFMESVRKALSIADAVLPSIDAGTPELYKKINRPHPDIPFERILEGLITFRNEFDGRLLVELMLLKGVNDTEEALTNIAIALKKVRPEKVHICIPTRPPAETWVKPTNEEGIMRATSILGEVTEVIHPQESQFDLSGSENVIDALIGIISRHPMSEEQLTRALESFPDGLRDHIVDSLKITSQVQIIERFGKQFWCASPSVFPDSEKIFKSTSHSG